MKMSSTDQVSFPRFAGYVKNSLMQVASVPLIVANMKRFGSLYGWIQIGNLSAGTGSYVSAVSRSTGKFDIFVAGNDGQVWTAASEPAFGLRGWWSLPGIRVVPNTPVAAASLVTDELAIFAVDVNGNLQASSWSAGHFRCVEYPGLDARLALTFLGL